MIHNGVKIDNLVQIAHNVIIGENTAIAAKTGIAGTTTIGKRCMIGGMVGIVGHLTITDDVIINATSTVNRSITKPGIYTGFFPLMTHAGWKKSGMWLTKLDKITKTLNKTMEMNINEVKNFLPHRYPFLMIDKVLDFKVGEYLTAIKNVSFNEPHFTGHFPEQPICRAF